jgi:hypothetical protein
MASLTRGPGLLSVLALIWVAWQQWRARAETPLAGSQRLAMAGALAAVAGSGIAFLWWRQAVGFAPMDVILRTYSGLELVDPARGLYYALAQVSAGPDLPTVLDVSSAVFFLGLTAVMAAHPRWRVGAWLIYMAANLAFFLSKHSLVASSLQSLARYGLVLFPAFIVLGDWLARQRRGARFAYLTLSSAGLLVLSVLYAFWFFIG